MNLHSHTPKMHTDDESSQTATLDIINSVAPMLVSAGMAADVKSSSGVVRTIRVLPLVVMIMQQHGYPCVATGGDDNGAAWF